MGLCPLHPSCPLHLDKGRGHSLLQSSVVNQDRDSKQKPFTLIISSQFGSGSRSVTVTMSSLTPLENTAIGAIAGMTEVTLMQPTVAIKNALQEGRPLPNSVPALYRGLVANASGMIPICATQFGMNRVFEGIYTTVLGAKPDKTAAIGVAMAAGASSTVFACPAEYIMIQQQKTGRTLPQELRHIFNVEGPLALYRGLSATIVREALYAAGYLGVVPLLHSKFSDIPSVREFPGGPTLLSGLIAGVLATVSTHPADTIKTRMQACFDEPQYHSFRSTANYIIEKQGARTLFSGLLPRGLRIVCAVFILTGTRSTLVDMLESRRGLLPAA